MKQIKLIADAIRGNLNEASRYLDRADSIRDERKPIADWFVSMAERHIAFNADGHKIAEMLVKEGIEKHGSDPLVPGMKAVYDQAHNDLIKQETELKARIAASK